MSNPVTRRKALSRSTHALWITAASALLFTLAGSLAQAADAERAVMPLSMSASPSMSIAVGPLDAYREWRDDPVQDWSAANDRVGEIGGWMTYLREAQAGEGETGEADTEGHADHGHHGH